MQRALMFIAALLLAAPTAWAEKIDAGSVTFVKGKAQAGKAESSLRQLKTGMPLFQGDLVTTGKRSRVELTLKDGSIVRLGGDSRLRLAKTKVNKVNTHKKEVALKLFVGRLWTNVTSIFGSSSKFEVETDNAVAGVRGTVFQVNRAKGQGTTLKVYEGNVLVSNRPIYAVKGHTKANRVAVSGPQEIAKQQWEEMMTKALEQVKVAEAGAMTKPAAFDPVEDEKDEWVAWNKKLDAKARPAKSE